MTTDLEIEHFWTAVARGWDIEPRAYFEKEAVAMGFKSPVEMAVHHMWKRHAKDWPSPAVADNQRPTLIEQVKQLQTYAMNLYGTEFGGLIERDKVLAILSSAVPSSPVAMLDPSSEAGQRIVRNSAFEHPLTQGDPPPSSPVAAQIIPILKCTCVPVTAAGVMVRSPRCPTHGDPSVAFTFAPGFDGVTGRPVMTYAVPSSPVAGITVNDFVCAVGEMTNEDALQRVKELVRAEDARIVAKCSPLNGCPQCNPDYPSAPSAPAAADDRKDP